MQGGKIPMFIPLFATMHDILTEIMAEYPSSTGSRKQLLDEQIQTLKTMSDTCIDEWLRFEEKLGALLPHVHSESVKKNPAAMLPLEQADEHTAEQQPTGISDFAKAPQPFKALQPFKDPQPKDSPPFHAAGTANQPLFETAQGYYKLGMFARASQKLGELVERQPEWVLARIYLALSHLHLHEYGEAYRQLKFILPLTDHPRMKAISHTALGCIHYENNNLDKALECFRLAYNEDPACMEFNLAYGAELRW